MRRWMLGVVCLLAGLTGVGCVGPYRADISSEDANERILGIRAAAEKKDWGAVPLIVDRLEDEDEAVRFYAIIALQRITGERFGYDYAQPSRDRAAAVSRWRAYVKSGGYLQAETHADAERRKPTRPANGPDA